MITQYLQKKLKSARYKTLEDGTVFAFIPGLKGVWANAKTLGRCSKELQEVLEDWLLLKVRDHEKVSGFSFRFDQRKLVRS